VHEPLFTCSTGHPPVRLAVDIWRALQRANGRILLTGHNHGYERFATMRADGTRARGAVREFVVGTGGAEFYPLSKRCRHRQAKASGVAGVLELTLRRHAYRWQFVRVGGTVLDTGRRHIG
jgi:acid phosphatase type 7